MSNNEWGECPYFFFSVGGAKRNVGVRQRSRRRDGSLPAVARRSTQGGLVTEKSKFQPDRIRHQHPAPSQRDPIQQIHPRQCRERCRVAHHQSDHQIPSCPQWSFPRMEIFRRDICSIKSSRSIPSSRAARPLLKSPRETIDPATSSSNPRSARLPVSSNSRAISSGMSTSTCMSGF